MTCKDCVHYEVCDYTSILDEFVEENCKSFKNKEKIISALEKQIPKKPTPQIVKGGKRLIGNGWWGNGTTVYRCPNCNEFISRTYDYCYKCGQAILWESE